MISFKNFHLLNEARWEDMVNRMIKTHGPNWQHFKDSVGIVSTQKISIQDEFRSIAQWDPTVEQGGKGTYIDWIFKAIKTGMEANIMNLPTSDAEWHTWEDGLALKETLTKFDQYKRTREFAQNYLHVIDRYSNLGHLQHAISEYEERSGISREREKQRLLADEPENIPGVELTLQEGDWTVYKILTFEGSKFMCDEHGWCTKTQSHFNDTYHPKLGELYVFLNKNKPVCLAFYSYDTDEKEHELKERFNEPMRPVVARAITPIVEKIPSLAKALHSLRPEAKSVAEKLSKALVKQQQQTDAAGKADIFTITPRDIGGRSVFWSSGALPGLRYEYDVSFADFIERTRKRMNKQGYIDKLAGRIEEEKLDQAQRAIGANTIKKLEKIKVEDNKSWIKTGTDILLGDGYILNSLRYTMRMGPSKVYHENEMHSMTRFLHNPFGRGFGVNVDQSDALTDWALLIPEFAQLADDLQLHKRGVHDDILDPLSKIWETRVNEVIENELPFKINPNTGWDKRVFLLLMYKAGFFTTIKRKLMKNETFQRYLRRYIDGGSEGYKRARSIKEILKVEERVRYNIIDYIQYYIEKKMVRGEMKSKYPRRIIKAYLDFDEGVLNSYAEQHGIVLRRNDTMIGIINEYVRGLAKKTAKKRYGWNVDEDVELTSEQLEKRLSMVAGQTNIDVYDYFEQVYPSLYKKWHKYYWSS